MARPKRLDCSRGASRVSAVEASMEQAGWTFEGEAATKVFACVPPQQ